MREKQKNVSIKKQISSINTDYVRSIEGQNKQIRAKKIRLYRRLMIFVVLSFLFIGVLGSMLFSSNNALVEKKKQQEQVEQELLKVQDEQEILNLQISKLNDDEYIGKLLRKEYFLSNEGEIIFSLPENDEK